MKPRITIIAAALLAATSILAASEANALVMFNGWSLNGVALNGTTASAVASQGFDFNNVSVQTVSWTWDCPLPLDGGKAVVCALGTSAEKRP
jgi:hypothetical protein